jgi:hypothetical protein
MPGSCIHEFFWPLRGADGRYHQVCRLCGAQCEYDWKNMRRVDVEPEAVASGNSSDIQPRVQLKNLPRLRLLVELEPAHRVFLRNLYDTLRSIPPRAHEFRSWSFWREVFFYSGLPWRRFGQSLIGHAVALTLVLIVSHSWTEEQPLRRSPFENTHLTYYKPDGSYPALRGNPAPVQRASRKQIDSARRGSIRVAPERAQADIVAPDIKLKGPARSNVVAPNLVASNPVLPAMPLASTGSSRFSGPSSSTAIVAPPPEVSQGTSRRLGLLHASGIAPAPQVGIESSRRVMTVSSAAVVGPPPVLQASVRRVGDMNIGPAAMVVVAPAPRLPVGEQRTISGALQPGRGSLVGLAVPPPPKVAGSGSLGTGRGGQLSGAGSGVVPPPPSVLAIDEAGNSAGAGRGGSLSGNSLSSAGVQVVPPPPSLGGAGGSDAGQRAGLFSGTGSGDAVQGVPPAPSVGEGGNSGHRGRLMAMANAPALAPVPPITDNPRQRPAAAREPPTQEMPLRLIGLAMALPSSTYFSNYEVYIAERRLRKNLTELVKLVYVYLPYQRRLSEYGVDNSKVYKLLVSRDRSCDESLMQMTWPENDPHPDAHNAADAPGLSAADKKSTLPCYRTTADDYRKAIAHR